MVDCQKVRKCTVCREPAEELAEFRRVCDVCHKRAQEARARPFVLTSAQRKKCDDNEIDDHFDENRLNREAKSAAHDIHKRNERQAQIQKRRINDEMARHEVKVELPDYHINRVLEYRDRVREILIEERVCGARLEGRTLKNVAEYISDALDIPTLGVILDAFAQYKDGMLYSDMEVLASRFAGNYKTLRKGIPMRFWCPQDEIDDWCLLEILRVGTDYEDVQGNPGFLLDMHMYTGMLSGRNLAVGYSRGVETKFARKLGVANKDVKKAIPKFLTGMVGYGYVVRGYLGQPRVRMMAATPSHKKDNSRLLNGRIDPGLCPFQFKPAAFISCEECPVGRKITQYNQPRCLTAIRPVTHDEWRNEYTGECFDSVSNRES